MAPLRFSNECGVRARAHLGIGMTCQQRIERDRGEALIGLDPRELALGPVLAETLVAGVDNDQTQAFTVALANPGAMRPDLLGDGARKANLEGN